MTVQEQTQAIVAGLQPWCREFKGSVHIAHDLNHLFKILGENPGSVRAGVLWVGDATRDDLNADVVGRCDNRFWIGFTRSYSLEAYPGKSLVEGIAGGGPMFLIIKSAKDRIRRLRIGTDDEPMPFYKFTDLFTVEGVTLDAYRMEIMVTSEDGDLTGDFETQEAEPS